MACWKNPNLKGSLALFILVILAGGLMVLWTNEGLRIYSERTKILPQPPTVAVQYSSDSNHMKAHLIRACEQGRIQYAKELEEYFSLRGGEWVVSEKFKLIACRNRKVGCTNISRICYILDHLTEFNSSLKVSQGKARNQAFLRTKNRTGDSIESQFNDYKKIMFVRDPLERLVSAYRDRRPGSWFGRGEPSFTDYLEFIIKTPDTKINLHMLSYTRLCNPCGINYDFIGTIKNFETDMRTIFKLIGVDRNIVPQRNTTGYASQSSGDVVQSYLENVSKNLIRQIYEKYYWDYFLFGFAKPDF